MDKRISYAKEFAREAGNILLSYFRKSDLKIEKKGPVDLVTKADKAAESYIIGSIFNRFPKDSILAEESGKIEKDSTYKWIIDPLDGTGNFAQGFSMFCVSIAIEKDNEIQAGVIYIPYYNEMFYATKNQGAFLNDKKIEVSNKTKLIDCIVATGFPYNKASSENNNLKLHNNVILKTRDIRRCGSAAIDLAYTALGIWDAYWEISLQSWDIAAGSLIVKEAGGIVSAIKYNENFDYYSGNILVSNKFINKELKDLLNL